MASPSHSSVPAPSGPHRSRVIVVEDNPQEAQRLLEKLHRAGFSEETAWVETEEEIFRLTFSHAAVGLSITDVDGRFLECNQTYCRMVGYTMDELREMDFTTLTHPDDREESRRLFRELVAGERTHFITEKRYQAKGGGLIWCQVSVSAMQGRDGPPMHIVAVAEDITARKQAEAENARLARHLSSTLESLTDAFFTLDDDWRITYWNAEAERVVGRSREELLGRVLWDEFPEAAGSNFKREYQRALEQRVTVTFEEYYSPLDIWLEVRAYPAEEGLVVYFRDVSEKRAAAEALRESEARFRTLVETAPDAIFIQAEERFAYVNAAAMRLFGAERPEQILDRKVVDFYHPDTREIVAKRIRQLNRARRAVPMMDQVLYPLSGEPRHASTSAVPFDYLGQKGALVFARDITERKRIEEALRESEERFRLLTRATNDAVWNWDLLTDQLWWSDGFEMLSGFDRSEIGPTIKSWIIRIHPDERDSVTHDLYAAIEAGADSWSGEYRFLRKDGAYVPVFDRGHVIRNAEGKAIRMVGGMTDLTERKEAETKLREQADLLDKARDAILVRDLDHHILYWNRSAERLYGWTANEVSGQSIRDLLYEDPTDFLAATQAVLEHGEWVGDIRQFTKDGHEVTVEGHWTLVRDDAGNPKSILAINTDVTRQRRMEQQFLRAQRMESIGTLAGGIAHDLNNVLSPIMMSIDILKMNAPDDRNREILETIAASARRGAEMVNQVLSFARGMDGQRVEVQLQHLVSDLVKIIGETFPKDIEVETFIAPNLWSLEADPTQLHQVLLNLCVNARDAMPEGGSMILTAENVTIDEHYASMTLDAHEGPYVKIEVEDTGTGMPREVSDKIFDPFFTTKDTGKGTGLGLPTSLAIVKSHCGFIQVYSDVGVGTKFRVCLPARAGTVAAPAETDTALPRGNGETILVIDDEAAIRHVTMQTLESFGYRVIVAEDGAQAMTRYIPRKSEIDLVLTDMMMPVMDGPTTIRALRKIDPEIRIIGASGINAYGKTAQETGADVTHFLPKPYTTPTLLEAVRRALDD